MMTIKELARLCNVSPATISNVLNGTGRVSSETADRVREAIRATGYRPSFLGKGLRAKDSGMIGVIADDLTMFNVPGIIDGIMECCDGEGYHIILENLRLYARWSDAWFDDDALYQSALQPALEQLHRFHVDGIVYVGGHERPVRGIGQSADMPVVGTYILPVDPDVPAFVLDDVAGGGTATRCLLDNGHRRIGFIGGEPDNIHVIDRLRGYRDALEARGIAYDPDLVFCRHWDRETGFEGAGRLLERGVTAVACAQDFIATGVYDYLVAHGLRAGRELSVVGYDDSDVARFLAPPMSSVALPLHEIGVSAAECLIGMLHGGAVPRNLRRPVAGTLSERSSVARI